MELKSINPATGEFIKAFPIDSDKLVKQKIELAQHSFLNHKKTTFSYRAIKLKKLAETLRLEKIKLAELMTSEMGKITKEALAEVEKCALVCDYYAENGASFLDNEIRTSDAQKSFVKYEPLGVLLAVMPWNFPLWQVFRFAAPAIMAGNTTLLKHASNVMGCAIAIQDLFEQAEFATNEFQTLVIPSSKVQQVIENDIVKAVTLTGSEYAGSQVASIAAKQIKKAVLELGGSDPFIVFEDSDLEKASTEAINARFLNCGQSCIAAKRFLIEKSVYDAFYSLFKCKIDLFTEGNPTNTNTTIGPMASSQLADELEIQLEESVKKGAKLYGGKRGENAFLSAGILSNIPKDAPAYKEELFGPIASFYSFETKEEAIEIANCTPFGLGSSIWTKDEKLIDFMISNLDAGAIFVNSMVKSDPRLPFGGIKKSGYGRELSKEGIREFVNIKTVYIK
jgi:succinate-semialdehyde dehydrogenase/glutarate-semialdehyde dehydrogenase